jgi:glycosyltransferase involved in cell wall biosynthesis
MRKDLHCADIQRETGSNRSLKVLRISHSGSVAAYRERERQLINSFPVDLKLIIPERWQHLGGAEDSVDENFEVVKAKTYGTGSIPLFAYDFRTILRYLKEFRPDLVDIHEEPYSVSCFEIVQMVETIHPKAACVFYSAQNIHKRYPPPFCWMEQYVYKNCVGAYPCSQGVKDVLVAKGFNVNSNVVPLGVDPAAFRQMRVARSPHKLQDDTFVVGYFGRLEECKGLEYVFRALRDLPDGVEWQMLVVGNGSYSSQLQKLAAELSIQERIIWIGEISANNVSQYINLCDVTVVPSVTTATWKEQFGRAVIESMACGVPVIASSSGSLPEVVGDAGIVVPEKDSQALFESLSALANNVELRRTLRERGLQKVEREYTWARVAQLTYDFYQKALRIRRSR